MNYITEIANLLSSQVNLDTNKIKDIIEIPPQLEFGDYAFPCFSLSKMLRKNPNQIAKDINKLIKADWLEKTVANGPYLNFYIKTSNLAKTTINMIKEQGKLYGSSDKKNTKIVIEFPGPNTNKPLHLGHVRNMILGESTSRILENNGNEVIRVDIVNDRGVHICKSMLAYKNYGNNKDPNIKSDHYVGKFYVMYEQNSTEETEKELQVMLKKWEENDNDTRALWKKMRTWTLNGFNETYKNYGIPKRKEYYESDHYEKGKEIVEQGLQAGIFEKDNNNNIIVNLEPYGLPKKILLRNDGTSIYMTQDLALAKLRFEDFNFQKLIYVVASEQNLHFQQLFKIFELLNYPFAKNCYHLSYGMISLPEGKMKSREGKVVDADDLFSDMITKAKKAILERHDNLNDNEIAYRAKIIAIAAIKFYILKYDPGKDFTFNPNESISFEGETGPYVQYAYARICSILHKAKNYSKVDFNSLTVEKALISKLYHFPTIVNKAAAQYKPSIIAHYLIELSQMFNEFYHNYPILKADPQIKNTRLEIINAIKQILKNGLSLLGIETLEQM